MRTTVDAGEQFGAGYGLGLRRLPLGCDGEVWGHAGEIPGYAMVAFSTRDAARQLVLMENLLPAPGGTSRRQWSAPSPKGSPASERGVPPSVSVPGPRWRSARP
jgi:hypothetical protein